jgi:hypothetical protein
MKGFEQKFSSDHFKIPQRMQDEMRIIKFCQEWSGQNTNTFVASLFENGLSKHDIAIVVDILDKTCRWCFDAPAGCRCWDDS